MQGQALIPKEDEAKLHQFSRELVEQLDPQAWKGPGYLDHAAQMEIAMKWVRRSYIMGALSDHKTHNYEEEQEC